MKGCASFLVSVWGNNAFSTKGFSFLLVALVDTKIAVGYGTLTEDEVSCQLHVIDR